MYIQILDVLKWNFRKPRYTDLNIQYKPYKFNPKSDCMHSNYKVYCAFAKLYQENNLSIYHLLHSLVEDLRNQSLKGNGICDMSCITN